MLYLRQTLPGAHSVLSLLQWRASACRPGFMVLKKACPEHTRQDEFAAVGVVEVDGLAETTRHVDEALVYKTALDCLVAVMELRVSLWRGDDSGSRSTPSEWPEIVEGHAFAIGERYGAEVEREDGTGLFENGDPHLTVPSVLALGAREGGHVPARRNGKQVVDDDVMPVAVVMEAYCARPTNPR